MLQFKRLSPLSVHEILKTGAEWALLDVREQGEFSRSHTLMASCAPLSRLEFAVRGLVPCTKASVMLMDAGGGDRRAEAAAGRLLSLGYSDVAVMEGGMAGWIGAGLVQAEGVGSLSKGFGEFIEEECGTPRLEPAEVHAMLASGMPCAIIDVRPSVEYERMNIPGSINLPGCEVTYRFADAVPGPDVPVIINCAGRTRSIIGTQTLINAGIPNKVYALKGGTMNWQLSGFTLEYGSRRRTSPPSADAIEAARRRAGVVAEKYGVSFVDAPLLAKWQEEAGERTLYVFDVRQPAEFDAGHLPGSRNAQGGQLVQATDEYAAVRNGRFVLVDDTECRAVMTAHWLLQMGIRDVHVLRGGLGGSGLGNAGLAASEAPKTLESSACKRIGCARLLEMRDSVVINVGSSSAHRRAHIAGAFWCMRSRLSDAAKALSGAGTIVVTSDEEAHAALAAAEASRLWPDADIMVLEGGNSRWMAAGLPSEGGIEGALCPVEDEWYRPYTDVNASSEAMRGYFDWESGLVDCIRRDGCAEFKVF